MLQAVECHLWELSPYYIFIRKRHSDQRKLMVLISFAAVHQRLLCCPHIPTLSAAFPAPLISGKLPLMSRRHRWIRASSFTYPGVSCRAFPRLRWGTFQKSTHAFPALTQKPHQGNLSVWIYQLKTSRIFSWSSCAICRFDSYCLVTILSLLWC